MKEWWYALIWQLSWGKVPKKKPIPKPLSPDDYIVALFSIVAVLITGAVLWILLSMGC